MKTQIQTLFKLFISLSLVLTSLPAFPLQIKLEQNMYLRTANGNYMKQVGKLTKGSIISIPDEYIVKENGKVDLKKTLDKWGGKSALYGKNRRETFFPIKVISAARGSHGYNNPEIHMALEFLERRRNASLVEYEVTRDTAVVTPAVAPEVKAEPTPTITPVEKTEANDAAVCTDCASASSAITSVVPVTTQTALSQISQQAEEASSTDTTQPPEENMTRFQGFRPGAAACNNFITRDGSYGSYGLMVKTQIERFPEFLNAGQSLQTVCPRFNTFSDERKKNFWVWIFASMADAESDCKNTAINRRSPNPPAQGLFQLEGQERLKRARNQSFGGNYCSGDMADPQNNIECAVAHMRHFTVRTGANIVRNSNQYWEVLKTRTRNKEAKNLINRYEGCHSGGRR